LDDPDVEGDLLPQPVEALRGVRVSSIAATNFRSYAVSDIGQLWAWGGSGTAPLGLGEQVHCPLPKPIESLRGVKMDAVVAVHNRTLALADDGSVYAWGKEDVARCGLLGSAAGKRLVPTAGEFAVVFLAPGFLFSKRSPRTRARPHTPHKPTHAYAHTA
jgi:alpha-tubulin suppressor-like RCC1 family protein